MEFQILGPMEAFDDGRPLALGGTKQKATLGYLLLQADRAVATSQLLHALWPVGEAPVSARKVLQNAVWGLRRALTTSGPPDGTPALVTQPPGTSCGSTPTTSTSSDSGAGWRRAGRGSRPVSPSGPR